MAAIPVETADKKPDAQELGRQWAALIAEAGLGETYGSVVRRVPGSAYCWGVFIEPYHDAPAASTEALARLMALAARVKWGS